MISQKNNEHIKILVSGMSGNYGGVESCIMNYIRNVSPKKIQFDFLCYDGKLAYDNEILDRGGKIYYLPRLRKYITYYQKLLSIFNENKYYGIWCNRCDLIRISVLVFKIAYKYAVPLCILHGHGTGNIVYTFRDKMFHEINKIRIEKCVTDFWACSQEAGSFFYRKKIINSPKFKVINNAINSMSFKFDHATRDKMRKMLGLENKLIIGHVGIFHPVKNHEFLLHVFHELYKKEPNSALLLIGDGNLRPKIESIAKQLNLIKAIHFLGIRYDIPELLNAMDIFILPSFYEGFPISLIEAQAASLYCFASTNVSSKTKITDQLSFIDLKKSAAEWADHILAKRNYKRVDMTEKISEAGYNIKIEAIKFEQFLLNEAVNIQNDAQWKCSET